MSAVIELMWIKIFKDTDGIEKFIPQFDSEGHQQFWTQTPVKLTKLIIGPISPEIAEKMIINKIPAASVPLPVWNFVFKPEDEIIAYWDNEIQTTSHFECESCGTCWQHMDSAHWAKCPKCGESDIWSCKRCGKTNIDNAIVHKNARSEVNCPYCEVPYGLNRTELLHRVQDIIENTDYVIEVKDRYKITIRQNTIDVESL
jgi:predicted RNA-binding Zn-ribbon protein involved in translation (DUF1610 family)